MAALDVTARQEMRRLVAHRCAEEGLTLLLVTHDVLDLTALAEDVVVLDRGRVVEQGPTARILSAPRSDFVAHLTGTAVLTGVVDGDAEAPGLRLPSGRVVHGRPGRTPLTGTSASRFTGTAMTRCCAPERRELRWYRLTPSPSTGRRRTAVPVTS